MYVSNQQESASINELAMLALDSPDSGWSPSDGPKQELAQFVVDLLTSKADMLADYFSLQMNKVRLPCRYHFQLIFHFKLEGYPAIVMIHISSNSDLSRTDVYRFFKGHN